MTAEGFVALWYEDLCTDKPEIKCNGVLFSPLDFLAREREREREKEKEKERGRRERETELASQ